MKDRSIRIPEWIRPYVPGELLNDSRERRCASPKCGAVFIRRGQSAESWANKKYCCGECYACGEPPIPLRPVIQK